MPFLTTEKKTSPISTFLKHICFFKNKIFFFCEFLKIGSNKLFIYVFFVLFLSIAYCGYCI